MATDVLVDILNNTTSGVEIARFELLMRQWRRKLLDDSITGASLKAKKRYVNAWLAEFERIFRDQSSKIGLLSTYTGFVSASVGADVATDIDTFLTQYRSTVRNLINKDLVQAQGLRNSLAIRVGREGVDNIYKSFEVFDKEARALGLSSRERVDGFLNSLGKGYSTIVTENADGYRMEWKPDKYARMYSNTRDSQLRDDLFLDQMEELDREVVQVSDHGTTTPICKMFEVSFFLLVVNRGVSLHLLKDPPFTQTVSTDY